MKQITQVHHIIYENLNHKQKAIVVNIKRGEHWLITQLNRHTKPSKGLIKCLKFYLALYEDSAMEV